MQTGPPPLKWSASTHAIHNTHFPSPSPLQPTSSTKIKQSSGRTIQSIVQSRGNLFLSCLFGILTKKKRSYTQCTNQPICLFWIFKKLGIYQEKKNEINRRERMTRGVVVFWIERERESERCCKPKSGSEWRSNRVSGYLLLSKYSSLYSCALCVASSHAYMLLSSPT